MERQGVTLIPVLGCGISQEKEIYHHCVSKLIESQKCDETLDSIVSLLLLSGIIGFLSIRIDFPIYVDKGFSVECI
jgi:hypothetical protein